MRIAVVGYGKMGRMIEAAAAERGHRTVLRIDPFAKDADFASLEAAAAAAKAAPGGVGSASALPESPDVAVEFTGPATAFGNLSALLALGVPAVVGSTGWHGRLAEAESLAADSGGSFLWSSNFSIGVNLLYRVAAYAASLFDGFGEYDVGGWEAHHNQKADSPSGTAVALVKKVLAAMDRKSVAVYDKLDRPPRPEELHFASLRVGAVPGTHTLVFDSSADSLEIVHTARSRDGFARGAIRAAEWLVGCPGAGAEAGAAKRGVHTMDEVLAELLPGTP